MDTYGYGPKYKLWKTAYVLIAFCTALFLLLGIPQMVTASGPAGKDRPKIGIVLSGGGARGAAHIGVLKVLEQLRIPIDCIAGTSMGAIVGGLYASGMTPDEIEAVVTRLDWAKALEDNIPRKDRSFRRKTDDKNNLINSKPGLSDSMEIKLPSGLKQGQNIDLLLKKLTLPVARVNDFDDFKIPFRAVATDIVTGNPVVLQSGDLATAMRASMSIPAIFSPVDIDGKLLVDGGVSNNLPVDIVRKMGADIVIAIDISTPLRGRKQLKSALSVTQQLTGILTRRNTEKQIATLTEKDVFILPDLGDITTVSFDRSDEAIPIGMTAAEQKKEVLANLSVSQAVYAEYQDDLQKKITIRHSSRPVIEFVKLDNRSRLSDKVIFARLKIVENEPLDVDKLDDNINKIYGLELFENISYELVEENDKTGVVIHIQERSWGPNYIQTGIALTGNQDGDNFYNLEFSYTRTAINRLNGEWKSAIQIGKSPGFYTEIYQPLSYDSKYFIQPRLIYGKRTVKLFSRDGDEIADYRLQEYGADLAVGRELGAWGEIRFGIKRLTGESKVQVGEPNLPNYDYERGEFYAKISADKLDDLDFPRNGYSGFIKYVKSDENIGADSEFDQFGVEANIAESWGQHTLLAGFKAFSTIDDNAPLQNRFTLGGLFNLSGYKNDELNGQQMGLFRLGYMRRINDFNLLPTYMGISIESGNVWEKTSDVDVDNLIFAGSVYIGVDTFLGPVYIGYGKAEGDNSALYFSLGKLF